jgi:putative Holliday junction resolvase
MSGFTPALGFDLGTKSLGVAYRNRLGMVIPLKAYFFPTVDIKTLAKKINEFIDTYQASLCVFGLPINQNGTESDQTRWVKHVLDGLRPLVHGTMLTIDERLTTVEAHERLQALNIPEKKRKAYIDSISACVILEQYGQTHD